MTAVEFEYTGEAKKEADRVSDYVISIKSLHIIRISKGAYKCHSLDHPI
jgi:hypothetical protein